MSYASLLSHSYDLRAIYPTEIDEDFFFRLGYAFAKYTGHTRIAVGYDARLSGASLAESFSRGVQYAGVTAIHLGLVSTDMTGFATCAYDDIESGAMITASHNPKEYNGVKLIAHSGEPYNLKEHGARIGALMDSLPEIPAEFETKKQETRDVHDSFVEHVLSFLKEKNFEGMRVVVDAGNGVAGTFMEAIQEKAKFEMIPLYLEPDGNFPNHHPNPII